jgi:hypothetical protein
MYIIPNLGHLHIYIVVIWSVLKWVDDGDNESSSDDSDTYCEEEEDDDANYHAYD